MNCLAVRDRLVERVLGDLSPREGGALERHLAWCAACRKEVGDLEAAAGTLAFALPPEEPDPSLEERIVGAVSELVTRRAHAAPRRGRLAVAAVVAAMLALAGLGWGAVMAGRASRLEQQAAADARHFDELQRFRDVITNLPGSDAVARVADLSATSGTGGGAALAVSSGTGNDMAIVLVSGLDPDLAPFTVQLLAHEGDTLQIGRIRALDADGGGELQRSFSGDDLTLFGRVVVMDRRGRAVLQGSLALLPTSPSPAP